MSMTDPIADMLTRIRNAAMAGSEVIVMPGSQLKAEIAALLSHEGYIDYFKIIRSKPQNKLKIKLRYRDGVSAIKGVKRVSRPGLRVYSGAGEAPKVLNGMGSAVMSTNKGILTDAEARELNTGGEVLCYVW